MMCRGVLLACIAALCVAAASAELEAAGRGLKSIVVQKGGFAVQPSFPYCVCKDYSSASSPYKFHLIDNNDTASVAVGEMCFVIKYKGPVSKPSACYTALEKSLFKVHLGMQPACPPSFNAAGRIVTVNGVAKTSGVEVQSYPMGSVLILTHLPLTAATADGTKICVQATYPCNIAENLFTAVPVPIAVMESSAHRCCPASGHF